MAVSLFKAVEPREDVLEGTLSVFAAAPLRLLVPTCAQRKRGWTR